MLERAATSGILTIRCHGSEATFGLREGEITWAHSSFGPRLGEALVKRGVITEGELALVQREQNRSQGRSAPFGTLIVGMGMASRGDVARELDEQILCILKETMTWRNGEYNVSPYSGPAVTERRRQQAPETAAISEFLVRATSA